MGHGRWAGQGESEIGNRKSESESEIENRKGCSSRDGEAAERPGTVHTDPGWVQRERGGIGAVSFDRHGWNGRRLLPVRGWRRQGSEREPVQRARHGGGHGRVGRQSETDSGRPCGHRVHAGRYAGGWCVGSRSVRRAFRPRRKSRRPVLELHAAGHARVVRDRIRLESEPR
jgi:hypothetical protein